MNDHENPVHARLRAFPCARAGFTLTETLTVIVIIAVVAAVLMPVITSVRNSARSVNSLSNLRQIGQFTAMWAVDHNNRYPLTSDTSTNGKFWFRVLEEDVLDWKRGGVNGNSVPPIFRCPVLNRTPLSENQATPDYASNTWVLIQSNGGRPSDNHPWPGAPNQNDRALSTLLVRQPSQTVMFTTATGWLTGRGFVDGAGDGNVDPRLQNGKAFGAVFCDGHTEIIPAAKVFRDSDKLANRRALFDPFYGQP